MEDVANRIRPEILCDKKVPLKVKGKFYKTVARPAMIYGLECGAINKKNEVKSEIRRNENAKTDVWCDMNGWNKEKYKRGSLGVANMAGKMRENGLRWFGHVER